MPGTDSSVDIEFTASFTHRLRFTQDVLGADAAVLADLLEAPPSVPARVLAVVEQEVDARTGITGRLRRWASQQADRVDLVSILPLSGGELLKNEPDRLLPLLHSILESGIDRRSYVLAVGGGALLDAVGLAAALAHRGVRLIRVPTTTMGQADSGIGVKNAVNFFDRKNWLGSFAVPWAVVNDQQMLASLDHRDWRCGFVEAVKVSLLKSPAFFDRLCTDAPAIARRDWTSAGPAIRQSAQLHLDHITRGGDPFETREARPLDFGHWAAHRLEPMTHFALRHGEAVAIGLAIDSIYSHLHLGLPEQALLRILNCLTDLGFELDHPQLLNDEALLNGLEEFRQHLGGRLTITLLRDVGKPVDVHEIDLPVMKQAIQLLRQRSERVSKPR